MVARHIVPILAGFSVRGLDQLAFRSPLAIVSALAVVLPVTAVSPLKVNGPALTTNACFKETIGKKHFDYRDCNAFS
ncbi:uncharacterized protein DS421_3g87540 [Arachis hypogaea]|nr:uncharacterized protein DS421_3g87540 [Arachis hypogaea]